MTTWLEFRSEPLNDVPEVNRVVRFVQDEPNYDLTCGSLVCGWKETTTDIYYSYELEAQHLNWHDEGMSE